MKITKHKRFIHCDNCGYEFEIKFDEVNLYINKKCPKCGEIMLTETDFENSKKIDEFIKTINTLCNLSNNKT